MLELRIQEAMSSGLHDYKVGDISVDYCCDKINLTLTSPGGEYADCPFRDSGFCR